jgi:hypothetical protein
MVYEGRKKQGKKEENLPAARSLLPTVYLTLAPSINVHLPRTEIIFQETQPLQDIAALARTNGVAF